MCYATDQYFLTHFTIIGFILGLVGLITGRSSGKPTGSATAGLVCSAIALIVAISVNVAFARSANQLSYELNRQSQEFGRISEEHSSSDFGL